MRFDANGGATVNYEPNSFGGPKEDPRYQDVPYAIHGDAARYNHREGNDDYSQAGDLYRLMSPAAKTSLVQNIVGSMKTVPERIQKLQISHFSKADAEYGRRVADGLGLQVEEMQLTTAK
jgi:catalase